MAWIIKMRPKWILFSILGAVILLAYYYSTLTTTSPKPSNTIRNTFTDSRFLPNENLPLNEQLIHLAKMADNILAKDNLLENFVNESKSGSLQCSVLQEQITDIDSLREFPNFEFQPLWMRSKEYWNKSFEDRYESQKRDPNRPPLKIVIVPHSHNDPGWLYTFEHYFQLESKKIINQAVAKLQQYPGMTFIWSEMSFLSAWWDSAHPTKRKALKKLVDSGQLEITTGGWVMPDEANTHLYALLDQYIEGHQWLKNNLEITPETGWSIDPFGHGATVPYMLSKSGIQGAVIQRIHYAWKQWFAQHQSGDFLWYSPWASQNPASILTHNQPFDIYSIKHSCGPHPYICLNFDFRKIKGEYTEYSIKAEFINEKNVKAKAELLLEQYSRTGSLLPHNVALIPLGDDFRYNKEIEFDQQYVNYKKLADYINSNKDLYNAEVSFGTPRDYFKAVRERYDKFPTFKGDFFVYSDIFTEGRPAYWSGYYTTRPFLKILDRELEHNLRSAEILFTIALNTARQKNYKNSIRLFEKNYETLIKARRNLGLFQHHDAITGTSKANVMRDYGLKIFESLQDMIKLQEYCLEIIYMNITTKSVDDQYKSFILNDMERESYDKLPRKLPIFVNKEKQVILFNSLAQNRSEIISLRVNTTDIIVTNSFGDMINFQINPLWTLNSHNKVEISSKEFELMFIAELLPLSVTTYYLSSDTKQKNTSSKKATIYCNSCTNDFGQTTNLPNQDRYNRGPNKRTTDNIEPQSQFTKESHSIFNMKKTLSGDIQLENHKMKLLIDGFTGFLKSIMKKQTLKIRQCAIEFGAYQSAQLHSGAYLFMPDLNAPEKDVLDQYSRASDSVEGGRTNIIFIVSGPISTQVTTIYGPFLSHTLRIYNTEVDYLADSIYIENEVDFESPPKNRETELFMRFQTDIQNGEPPEFYTDQNGFQYQKRIKVDKIGIEGNYYPITTMAFLQDQDWRLTYVTGHAQGASAFEPGRLEIMLDRRTLYDDSRGMGEGLVDNRKTMFRSWLLSESLKPESHARLKRNTKKNFKTVKFINSRSEREIFRNFPQRQNNEKEFSQQSTAKDTFNVYELPSYNAVHFSQKLNYPVNIFIVDNLDEAKQVSASVSLLRTPFPKDIHLVSMRTLTDSQFVQFPSRSCLFIVQRMGYKCNESNNTLNQLSPSSPFIGLKIQSLLKVSLTGLHKIKELKSLEDLDLPQMELQTINMTFV